MNAHDDRQAAAREPRLSAEDERVLRAFAAGDTPVDTVWVEGLFAELDATRRALAEAEARERALLTDIEAIAFDLRTCYEVGKRDACVHLIEARDRAHRARAAPSSRPAEAQEPAWPPRDPMKAAAPPRTRLHGDPRHDYALDYDAGAGLFVRVPDAQRHPPSRKRG